MDGLLHEDDFAARRPVRAIVQFGPNFVFHLAAVARIGFDSEYADKYVGSVGESDLGFLQRHRELLTFGMGSGSDLVTIFLFLPAYFDLQSEAHFAEYFSLLDDGCAMGTFRALFSRYGSEFERLGLWIAKAEFEKDLSGIIHHRELIRKLGEIVMRNLSAYRDSVWSVESAKMEEVSATINKHFGTLDPISAWEKVTGIDYKLDCFRATLVSAIKNGPNADSLAYDTVVFHHDRPFDYTVQLIQHEIGSHILNGTMKQVADLEKYEWKTLYAAYECLAKHYNQMLIGTEQLAYSLASLREEQFLPIYRSVHKAQPAITPRELLLRGLESYLDGATYIS
jgi:hypothetical protein